MLEILVAENSGFCFGVKQAIEKAEYIAKENHKNKSFAKEENQKGRVYTCGPIIHNSDVTNDLKKKGIDIIKSLAEAKEQDIVIVRSHGEPKSFYEEAEKRQLHLEDATCPFVKKIHNLVREAYENSYNVVVCGDENHQEVIGINGWCDNKAIIVDTIEKAEKVQEDNLFVVAQTTIQEKLLDEVVKVFKDKGKKIIVKNTICDATQKRQDSCKNTANKVDLMIVIGGKHSSNSKKLFEIAKNICKKTYFIENKEELPLKEVIKCSKIGVAAGASTPECVIEEVIATMSEIITENNERNLMDDLMDEIEKSLRLPRSGEIVNGKVHQVTEKEVIVNLGCKKDGVIPKEELTLEEGQKITDLFKEGDEVQAKVIKTDDGDGTILLSKKKLEVNEHWDEINDAFENKSVINVKVVKQVNGGVIAVYKEVSGFIPLSQLSDKFVENAEEFMGKILEVRITKVDSKRGKAVFSRKAVLAEERAKRIEEVWSKLDVGDIVEGKVMRFTDYGAFLDVGGIDGLLHISEISWGKLKHPQEVLTIGEKLHVKVLSMNSEKGKISLGLKQNQPEPWSVIEDKYQVGQTVEGKVVQIKEYGAFVELEPGLDGLVHISEVAHKRVTNIADEISVGQEVSAKILEIDTERRRISLSIKETLEAPIQKDFEEEEYEQEAEEEN